jgi:hypothetical protein
MLIGKSELHWPFFFSFLFFLKKKEEEEEEGKGVAYL